MTSIAPNRPLKLALAATGAMCALWLAAVVEWLWMPEFQWFYLEADQDFYDSFWHTLLTWYTPVVLPLGLMAAGGWCLWAWPRRPLVRNLVLTAAYVPLWACLVWTAEKLEWHAAREELALWLTVGFYVIGFCWAIWGLEKAAQWYRAKRFAASASARHEHAVPAIVLAADSPYASPGDRVWNPLDEQAWYYGKKKKLNHSLAGFTAYSLAFLLLLLLFNLIPGCGDIYEMPFGGGEVETMAKQTVQIKKVKKIKYVLNPFSSIIFSPPPLEKYDLQLEEATAHMYKVGQGVGEGAGFSGGTGRGKVRFIRLEYAGGDWDQGFGESSDLNMLLEYGARTGHPVSDRTESRTIGQLARFPLGKSPPLVYMTGEKSISLSKNEIRILREYITEKHGMLFGDNGGSGHFHNQFFAMMREVLPTVDPVPIPLDDPIHTKIYKLPFLPFVAPHGGRVAQGWKMEGRWVCYYHPGDIGDAWSDEHAGVRPEVWENCYRLGVNVILYAHAEYNKWVMSRQKR